MTNLNSTVCMPQVAVRAFTFTLVIVAVLVQSLIGAVHPYQHGTDAKFGAPVWALTADSASSAQQALPAHDDTDDSQCALCLALHASSNCVDFKTSLLIAPNQSRECRIPGPAFRLPDNRRYALAQQRAPPLTV